MSLFRFLGKIFNPITDIFGVKLFPGGPYADRGLGDLMMKKGLKAEEILARLLPVAQGLYAQGAYPGQLYSQLALQRTLPVDEAALAQWMFPALMRAYGFAPESVKTGAARQELPYPELGGMYALLPRIYEQYAQTVGLPSPMGRETLSSPYELLPVQQQLLNQEMDIINQERQNAIARLQHNLARQGIRGAPLQAAVERLNAEFDRQVQQRRSQYLENVRAQRETGALNLAQALGQLGEVQRSERQQNLGNLSALFSLLTGEQQRRLGNIGSQIGLLQSLLSTAATGSQQMAGLYGAQAQQAAQNQADAQAKLLSLVGLGIGAGRIFPGVFLPPRQTVPAPPKTPTNYSPQIPTPIFPPLGGY